MKIVADRVFPDEPCWGYFTGPRMMPGYTDEENPRMIEQVFVIRGDAIACYEQDFGHADNYTYVPPLMMPSYGENSVALMQWHGERHRNDDKWGKRMEEYKATSTLFEDVLRAEEQRHEIIKNRTSLGPHINVQRNDWSHETALRRFNDKRRSRTGRIQL